MRTARGFLQFMVCATVVVSAAPIYAINLQAGDILGTDDTHVYRIDPASGVATIISSGGNLSSARGVTLDGGGQIIVVCDSGTQPGKIVRINPANGAQTVLYNGAFSEDPWYPVVLSNGNILFTDYWNATSTGGKLRVLNTSDGGISIVSSGGLFRQVLNMCVSGNIVYITDHSGFVNFQPRIVKYDASTNTQSLVSATQNLVNTYGIVRDKVTGNLYVADADAVGGNGAIFRIDPNTGAQTLVSSGGFFADPYDLTFDLTGQLLTCDYDHPQIVRVNPVTGAQSLLSLSGADYLYSIAVVPEPTTSGFAVSACVLALQRRHRRR